MNKDKKIGRKFHSRRDFISLIEIIRNEIFDALIKIVVEPNNLIGEVTKTDRRRIIQEIRKGNENAPLGYWIAFFA